MDRHSEDDPTNQYSVNESEWENPENWWGGLLYHSKEGITGFGFPNSLERRASTINVRRPLGLAGVVAILALIIVGIVRAALRY